MIRNSGTQLPRARTAAQKRVDVFVLIDALGWEYLKAREFLNDLLPYRQPLQTILGFSSGAIPAILTGVSPSVNGHWNLFYYDPQGSPFRWFRHFGFLPDFILNTRVTRKLLKEMGRRLFGLGPLFECCVAPRFLPYFNWVETRNIYDRGGIAGAPSIFDQLSEGGVSFRVYSYHHSTDAEILGRAEEDIREHAASFYFLYLSEMDMFLHMHCEQPKEVEERLRWYDRGLRKVFSAAQEAGEKVTLTITSDHGMTPVHKHYDLMKSIESLELQMPKDYLVVYDSTMARFWFFNDRARSEITAALQGAPCGRLLPDEELKRLGVFFEDRRFGEIVFLLHPGWLLSRSDFNGKQWTPSGMHGYHPNDSYSDAVFLSNHKPAFPLHTVQDVHKCMHEAMESVMA